MPVNIVNRQDAEAIIREQVVQNIFQDAPKQSVFMSMARKLPNMTSNQTRIRVLDFLPEAYWVNGDTGMKQTSRQAWDNVFITAAELAVIVPIPEAVLDDAEFDIMGEVTPRVNEAIGKRVDAAIIFGDNKPAEWQNDIITLARQAGNNVPVAEGKDYFDLILGEDGVFSKVENDGYGVSGAIAPLNFKSKLRGLRDANGNPIFMRDPQSTVQYSLDGTPLTFPQNGSFFADIAQLVAGDFTQAVYAIRQDVTVKILDQGIIQDPQTKEIVYNLAQQDMIALRVVFRMGWALPNPATRLNEDRTGCAFAYLEPASPVTTQAVKITVKDSGGNLKDAKVNLNGAILKTDASGLATFNLRKGNYQAKVTLKGYIAQTIDIAVDASEVTKTVTLVKEAA